jgi:hypothetical protein
MIQGCSAKAAAVAVIDSPRRYDRGAGESCPYFPASFGVFQN